MAAATTATSVREGVGDPARSGWAPRVVLAAVVVVALVLRWWLVPIESGDFRAFLDPWYTHLADSGGFAGLADAFSNYNTPYLALLALLTYLPVSPLIAIKALSVLFDLVLAGFAYAIVRRLLPGARWRPVIAVGAVLLLPTVVMNSAAWAQCDAIYAAFCLGSLYFLISKRPGLACLYFGLALAFKLQAIFFLPVLVVVMILNRHRLRSLLAIPAAFLAALVPALMAGRSLLSQLQVYPAQISNSSGAGVPRTRTGGVNDWMPGGAGGGPPGGGTPRGGFGLTDAHSFTYNAPTPYAWLPSDASTMWKYAGLAAAAAVALAFGVWLLSRRRPLTPGLVVLVAATATLVVPILLPEMHERYFYLAEVLAVLAAFVDRRFIVVAGLLQLASISTYLSYLTGTTGLPLEGAAGLAVGAAVLAAALLVTAARQNRFHAAEPDGRHSTGADRDPVAQRQT